MPEIKNQFTGGKMNKDLDERLIPNGEYRDAMNIQVSTSEGSDVGAVQNILGNSKITFAGISSSAICVGAIADEKNDKLYWFIRDTSNGYDGIFRYISGGGIRAVLIDKNLEVLKFNSSKIITGINIIDDMLFWTDNKNEPRKINIERSIDGTDISGMVHTNFINPQIDFSTIIPIREEHITVIKKHPTTAPIVKLIQERGNDEGMIYTGVMRITSKPEELANNTRKDGYDGGNGIGVAYNAGYGPFWGNGLSKGQKVPLDWNETNQSSMWMPRSILNHHYDFSQLKVGDYFDTQIETDIYGESGFELDWNKIDGDVLLFEAFGGDLHDQVPDIPLRNYSVKARIVHKKQYQSQNIGVPNSDKDLSTGTDLPVVLGDSPWTSEVVWKQQGGSALKNIHFQGRKGFDGRISEIHIYEVVNGVPLTTIDLCPNPYFRDTDLSTNAALPRWYNPYGCMTHGGSDNIHPAGYYGLDHPGGDSDGNGRQYSLNPALGYNGTPQSGDFIDPMQFPCYPGSWSFHIYPKSDPRYKDKGPWYIVHSDDVGAGGSVDHDGADGGFIQHGGTGYNDIQEALGGVGNYGGLINTYTDGAALGSYPAGDHLSFSWQEGGSNGMSYHNGYDHWLYYANNEQIAGADGNTYNSYDIMNQNGYIKIKMDGTDSGGVSGDDKRCTDNENDPGGCFGEGRTYQMLMTFVDTGHTYGNKNGGITMGGAGIVNPWTIPNHMTDSPKEMIQNGDFIEPDGNGNLPKHWNVSSSICNNTLGCAVTYTPGEHYVELGKGSVQFQGFGKLNTNLGIKIEMDQTYEISFELSDIGIDSEGVFVAIVGENFTEDYYYTPVVGYPGDEGVHNFTITTVDPSPEFLALGAIGLSSGHRIYFQPAAGPVGFIGRIHNISVKRIEAPDANVSCEVLAIHNPPTAPEGGEIKFAVDLEPVRNKIYEFKFPRFAYRYQYGDNEYSAMSPFSPVAFVPGDFRYHPKEGFNLAMTNRLIQANIKGFMIGIPDGVIAIDILFKDDKSPSIYIVDTIKPKHTATIPVSGGGFTTTWIEDEYTINSEQVNSMLTSNQLLRPWDAVPLKALAQDVTGNRIVYGNYTQGFNLEWEDDNDNIEEYYPDFKFDILSSDNLDFMTKKSIKSLREYQLGIVFADKYGRETPVISNSSGTRALEKEEGRKVNQMQVGFNNIKFPKAMKYFKFFVKETSNEYYNLAMDRWYDAEDGGAWLAFPSSDRNKVDIDTFLFLKKATDSDIAVVDETKYKILDIQSNAPAFIKQKKTLISTTKHDVDVPKNDIFGADLEDAPRVGEASFKMNYDPFHDSSGSDLDEIKDGNLWVEFESLSGSITKRYRISTITNDYDPLGTTPIDESQYSIILTEGFGSDIDLITDDPFTGLSATKIKDGTIVNVYKYTEEDQAKFDGRFFAKISVDLEFFKAIIGGVGSGKYRRVNSKKLYYLAPDNSSKHDSSLTGQTKGLYATDFGRFAPFFRNYNKLESHLEYDNQSGSTEDVGQYAFGPDLDSDGNDDRPWLQELAYYTTAPTVDGFKRDNNEGNVNNAPSPKVADSHDWDSLQREGVFNDRGEQTHGDVWFIDGGPFHGENAPESGDELKWADGTTRLVNPAFDPATADYKLSSGIEDSGSVYFNIAVGGIYNQKVESGDGGSDSTPSFFDIKGNSGANTQKVVERISPGEKFRFREDPNNDIYTIQQNVENQRRTRWDTIQLSTDTVSNSNYAWDYEELNSSGAGQGTWFQNAPSGSDNDNDYTVFGPQLSPNFSRGWRPRVLNSAGESEVHWNPTGILGPITNGLKLSINHSSEAAALNPPNVYVHVDSLVGTDENTGVEHNITVGMIMTSHSDAATVDDEYSTDAGEEYLAIKEIEYLGLNLGYNLHLTGYSKILVSTSNASTITLSLTVHNIFSNLPKVNQAMIFEQPTMNGYSQYSVNRINAQDPADQGWDGPTIDAITGEETDSGNPGIMAIGYNLDFLEEVDLDSDSQTIISENPAIWETEPKESVDLDLYHEASGYYPLTLESYDDAILLVPTGSIVETVQGSESLATRLRYMEPGTTVNSVEVGADGNLTITLVSPSDTSGYIDPNNPGVLVVGTLVGAPYITNGDRLKITKPNGEIVIVTIVDAFSDVDINGRTTKFIIGGDAGPWLYGNNTNYILNWHNCYSFGNGVESNRVRDNFNLPFISNGPKVSTIWEGDYNQEHRKYGLIYSGLYNSNSGVNNLNQFIAAEKITKDINPIYGSIQKLHSRDSDLVTLCEDKCLRILANKDAVFNADGNPNLVATSNVLGQTIPFSGEFGISKNPESFASESYRAYFTDKVRGVVMRLSKDGLTPISMYGMKDWFKDNLRLSSKLIGSYDDRKDEYNITLKDIIGGGASSFSKTVSFKEDVKGWVSFKSFIPEFGISMASNYYTMKDGALYMHHNESRPRNTFYNSFTNSSINVILNTKPGIIKSFRTLNYEGSQAKINLGENMLREFDFQPPTDYNDQEYYNLSAQPGWRVESSVNGVGNMIKTDQDTGYTTDFIEKEGKWFANINKFIDINL